MAWHMLDHLKDKKLIAGRQIHRISFNEITPSAIKIAVENPRNIDQFLVKHIQGGILDHLIGFKVSPLLWSMFPERNPQEESSLLLRMICARR